MKIYAIEELLSGPHFEQEKLVIIEAEVVRETKLFYYFDAYYPDFGYRRRVPKDDPHNFLTKKDAISAYIARQNRTAANAKQTIINAKKRILLAKELLKGLDVSP